MKKLLFYLLTLSALVFALDGCKKEKNPAAKPSEISVKQPEIYPGKSGEFSVRYSIENPKEGVTLEAATEDKWITVLTADEMQISFSLTTNDTGNERTGSIALSYEGAEPAKITIRQEALVYQPIDENGTANCYIVSEAGNYKFAAVKGNGSETVGTVAAVEVLWESFGTDTAPNKGDLIAEVSYVGNKNAVCFVTGSEFLEGNAVIAAKDASGKILWSWHIWMTDKPEDQVYNNGAGTMMDRNLGAISAIPGDVGALGLLYQWGRKDPFMGSSDIADGTTTQTASTIETWPEPIVSDETKGTIDYAVANPTVFIRKNANNNDWYYAEYGITDDTRWQSSKTIYDPCPPGYRVPDGGYNGVWVKAFGTDISELLDDGYDSANEGFNFGSSGKGTNKLSDSVITCWYSTAGYLYELDGSLSGVGNDGRYWSCFPNGIYIDSMYFDDNGFVYPSNYTSRAAGASVRCLKE